MTTVAGIKTWKGQRRPLETDIAEIRRKSKPAGTLDSEMANGERFAALHGKKTGISRAEQP
jgi:hypothetical protein